jgi:hypothetical protein
MGTASQCGRTECVPPRKPAPALFQGFPRKAILPWTALPAEGRAPHARNDGIGLAGACPHLATRYSFAPDDHVMPRLVSGLATRTRRPRPSEKTTFRVICPGGFPRKAIRTGLASPKRKGGLRTPARKGTGLTRGMSPLGHRPVACLPVIMTCLGLAYGRYSRARRPRPSEKTTFRVIWGFPRKAIRTGLAPKRRGGLRTPARRASRQPDMWPPFSHGPLA